MGSPTKRPALAGLLLVCLLALAAARGAAQPYGIDARVPNTSLLIDTLPPDTPGTMQAVNVFPNVVLSNATFLAQPPAGPGRLWVLEKGGAIKSFPYSGRASNPTAGQVTTILNLATRLATSSEQGLLGLAFSPDYASTGHIYLHYSWNVNQTQTNPGRSRISRFTVNPPTSDSIDIGSEVVLLEVTQPSGESNHKGGMIEFGPDGMLYIALGDGGGGGDGHGTIGNGQDTTTLLGKILRIDPRGTPDAGLAYRVPPDNPFYNGGPMPGTRREIYAYGLRNPWRFSFDKLTGQLIAGEVGQGQYEEVDVITAGGNYGWRRKEGFNCYNPSSNCDAPGLIDPIHVYDHGVGQSITGGYVYFGSDVPELYGLYIYADYVQGLVWGMRVQGGAKVSNTLLVDAPFNISSFGQDLAGEVYIVGYASGSGRIYALSPTAPGGGAGFPTRLSDIPALLAAGQGQDQTAAGIVPYRPSSELWSDGALKSRYLALPGTTQVGHRAAGGWDFPEHAVLIKNFALPLDERDPGAGQRRIETRLLTRQGGQWYGFSYAWNDAQDDAVLLPDSTTRSFDIIDGEGHPQALTWQYPSRTQCMQCHTAAANFVLGLHTPQMNSPLTYPASGVADNQLRTLEHIGLFSAPLPAPPDALPRMPDYHATTATLELRARAYLASNCSMCHQPGGGTPVNLDLRWETARDAMGAVNMRPGNGNLGLNDPWLVRAGQPQNSVLLLRMDRRGGIEQMPPLGTHRIDAAGVELIRTWIGNLNTGARHWEQFH